MYAISHSELALRALDTDVQTCYTEHMRDLNGHQDYTDRNVLVEDRLPRGCRKAYRVLEPRTTLKGMSNG